MTENEKIELFDKWYDENYDEWAEGEEGIALREELEQAFKSGIAELEKENAELRKVAEFGYNKANEWHYVKDGDLPEEDDVYLVYTTKGVLLGHYEQGGADGETSFTGEPYSDFTEYPSEMLFTEDEVIAWKEIVLPKVEK